MSENLAIVLAAGKGTRMKSDLPKVLVKLAGRPMLEYVLDALGRGGVARMIVVVGYRAEAVRAALDGRYDVQFVLQREQLGTGHAVMACREFLQEHHGPVLVVAGDAPLMQGGSIRALLEEFQRRPAACLLGTARTSNPAGLGRILRAPDGAFLGIVEHKDASEEQRRIDEVNISYYVFNCQDLLAALDRVRSDNAQGEYYLTDCPGILLAQGKEIRAVNVLQSCEALSINTMEELAAAEAVLEQT
ncbi:MAG: NTP transferase domain-containing protein [Thermoguttaceae bacterium]|jgi:bifunctional UDP-N-acetylglucosamine pyrophosphorylase/glucosamine-1-phosphate N-acetyltransferase/UDP-N-acetylglucosamine pyrophosphorylase